MIAAQSSTTIQELVPLFFVDDINRSVAFYCDQLRFEVAMKWEPEGKLQWCRVQRGGAAVMLEQASNEEVLAASRGHGVEFFFNCDDAKTMHAELTGAGMDTAPPKLAFYGMNQIFLADPDGYQLCFQSPSQNGN